MTRPRARHLLHRLDNGAYRTACGRPHRSPLMGTRNPLEATCWNCKTRPEYRRTLHEVGRALVAMAQGLASISSGSASSAARTPRTSIHPA